MRIEYFGIRVTNLERSLKFYTENLGLKEVRRGDFAKYGAGTWILLRDEESGQQLELNWYPPDSRYSTPYVPGEGLDHIGFKVENLEEKFKKLVAKGAEVVVGPAQAEGWQAYLKDPDGNWIELFKG